MMIFSLSFITNQRIAIFYDSSSIGFPPLSWEALNSISLNFSAIPTTFLRNNDYLAGDLGYDVP